MYFQLNSASRPVFGTVTFGAAACLPKATPWCSKVLTEYLAATFAGNENTHVLLKHAVKHPKIGVKLDNFCHVGYTISPSPFFWTHFFGNHFLGTNKVIHIAKIILKLQKQLFRLRAGVLQNFQIYHAPSLFFASVFAKTVRLPFPLQMAMNKWMLGSEDAMWYMLNSDTPPTKLVILPFLPFTSACLCYGVFAPQGYCEPFLIYWCLCTHLSIYLAIRLLHFWHVLCHYCYWHLLCLRQQHS